MSCTVVLRDRFQVELVLSEPSDSWTGRKGRVDEAMLSDFLVKPHGSRCYVCVCGPAAFTKITMGYEDNLYCFQL